jgi:hypothetical protein
LIRNAAALARILPHFAFSMEEKAARRLSLPEGKMWQYLLTKEVYYESIKRCL